jgi:hypothetical protein
MNWRITLWGLVALLVLAVVQLQREINALETLQSQNFKAFQADTDRFLAEEAIMKAAMRQDVTKSMDQLNALSPDYTKPLHWPTEEKTP